MTETLNNGKWKEVWESRRLDPSRGSILAQLMAADGLDTGFGDVDESNWLDYVTTTADFLSITPESSVFEVGCGAGAFLYELHRRGCAVGGIDLSSALIDFAREALPNGTFNVAEASQLDTRPQAEVVLASGVFLYFPSLEYATQVVNRMVAKSTRAIALLDMPDAATKAEAMAHRIETVGGEEAYAARYEGLDHFYYDREWAVETLRSFGVRDIEVADQHVKDYENARFRFNAWGYV